MWRRATSMSGFISSTPASTRAFTTTGRRPRARSRSSCWRASPSLPPVSLKQLNRWTLARQMLLERVELDAVTAIERLAGMQAQYSPSPYIGLWSRVRDFKRDELETALAEQLVYKATLMRGTLHLVSARQFDLFRVASRFPRHVWSEGPRQLAARGIDVDALG